MSGKLMWYLVGYIIGRSSGKINGYINTKRTSTDNKGGDKSENLISSK
jgi:hypothetical protein